MQAVIEMSEPLDFSIGDTIKSDRQAHRFGGNCSRCRYRILPTVQPYLINGFWVSGVRALFALTVRGHKPVIEMSTDLKLVS